MNKLTLKNAKEYALIKFKQLPDLHYQWNIIHSEGIIKSLEVLINNKNISKEKLSALAWVHDIGKIKSEENHARISVKILRRDFELDEVDIDCILNHGSSAKPRTKEGKIFRYADGLSLFVPKTVNFKFYAEAKEGKNFEEVKKGIGNMYKKYREKYSESEKVVKLLNKLYERI